MAKRRFRHLTKSDRLTIDKMKRKDFSAQVIAETIGVHLSTVYRELHRGRYIHMNTDLTTEERYSPEIAHNKYRENLKAKGSDLKIGNDHEYASYLEDKVVNGGYSPEAALALADKEGRFKTRISKTTFYSYIDADLFANLSNKELPIKGRRKKKNKKVHKKQSRANAGDSIEKRPEEIDSREEFGHWEMDSVVGPQGQSKCTLLVLTERKTRDEIIRKLDDHSAAQVVQALDALELEWGDLFRTVFKTITVDNGSEFADCAGIEKSALSESSRTKVYYCHPYCSCERGSNEVANRMIRRRIPKGVNFDNKTKEEIQEIEDWMNTYPRKIFGYETAEDRFQEELSRIA